MTRKPIRYQSADRLSPVVLGPYELGIVLGKGGMGEVYRAYDRRLDRWVAVKRLLGETNLKQRARFRREARILAQLGHPGIVQIFDLVEDDEAGDAIVMELIDGPTLAELGCDGPLDIELALDYAVQIAAALDAAHSRGVVHCDLKTENVMVLSSGHVKVLDFGLARRLTALGSPGRGEGFLSFPVDLIVGTPRTMSPEQALQKTVDRRSDLFSFGVLLYELFTSRSPFAASDVTQTLHRVVKHQPPRVDRLEPAVPRPIAELVSRLLAKDPEQRPAHASVVEDELTRLAFDRSSSTPLRRQSRAMSRDEAMVTTLLAAGGVDDGDLASNRGNRRRIPSLLAAHGGRVVESVEERLLAIFDRPWGAFSFALAYHELFVSSGSGGGVGIHLGEVILHHAHDASAVEVEGPAKPTVTRLQALAVKGQTLVTLAAYEVLRRRAPSINDPELLWRWHGDYCLHGVGDEVGVFEATASGSAFADVPTGAVTSSPEPFARSDRSMPGLEPLTPVTLRTWPSPERPEHPYPVLLPYRHPDLIAGRDAEIARIRTLLETTVPIVGLSAPSGTGKSSVLLAGLVPRLRLEGVPVSITQYPAEAGVAARMIGDLLVGVDAFDDHDYHEFIARLAEVERLAGVPPVLVLDQFEDVLNERATAARAALGLLIAATVTRRPGLSGPRCRWLVAYRQEAFGKLRQWLGCVLDGVRSDPGVAKLPHDLTSPERFQYMSLSPLATPPAGVQEARTMVTQVFFQAITKPLERLATTRKEGTTRLSWHISPDDAERLAVSFADARLARPDMPLVPELQVVLAHLLAEADDDGRINVPENTDELVTAALDAHLRRALATAFPDDSADSATRRARALLALRSLADHQGRRERGATTEGLVQLVGDGGEALLERLSTPLTRLVVMREAPDGLRWSLAHDAMAEVVVRLVEEEGRQGRLVIDSELLALRRLVRLRLALFRAGETVAATRMDGLRFRRIAEHADALLYDEQRRAWFAACRHWRGFYHRRLASMAMLSFIVLGLIGWSASVWSDRRAEQRNLQEQVVHADPDVALHAANQLVEDGIKLEILRDLLARRDLPADVLERGLGGVGEKERSLVVLRLVELLLPWVDATPEDAVLVSSLTWALDYGPARDPAHSAAAGSLRERVLAPLRRLRPPPPLPLPDDPDWIEVPAGEFSMGLRDDGPSLPSEQRRDAVPHEVAVSAFRILRHEVTNREFRRLVPGYNPRAKADYPVVFTTWYEGYTYAAWLGGRLPTEAEWEYAARAGCPVRLCASDGGPATLEAVAWTSRNSRDAITGEPRIHEVMTLAPNSLGLFDMLGNSWEWTADWFAYYPSERQHDPWGPPVDGTDVSRIFRGGSFWNGDVTVRAGTRARFSPNHTDFSLGFRVVLPHR